MRRVFKPTAAPRWPATRPSITPKRGRGMVEREKWPKTEASERVKPRTRLQRLRPNLPKVFFFWARRKALQAQKFLPDQFCGDQNDPPVTGMFSGNFPETCNFAAHWLESRGQSQHTRSRQKHKKQCFQTNSPDVVSKPDIARVAVLLVLFGTHRIVQGWNVSSRVIHLDTHPDDTQRVGGSVSHLSSSPCEPRSC